MAPGGNRKCNNSNPVRGVGARNHHQPLARRNLILFPWSRSGSASRPYRKRQALGRHAIVPYNYTRIGGEASLTVAPN